MADAKAIAPSKGSKAIVPSIGSDTQSQAFARALASDDPKHPGYTLDQARERIIAAGAPIWTNIYGRTDLRFMVGRNPGTRSKAGGGTHLFMHTEPKGKRTPSKGVGNEPDNKDVNVPSVGDDERRWKHIGGDLEALPANVTLRARKRMTEVLESLRENHSLEEIKVTPFMQWAEGRGLVSFDGSKLKAAKRTRSKSGGSKTTSTGRTRTRRAKIETPVEEVPEVAEVVAEAVAEAVS